MEPVSPPAMPPGRPQTPLVLGIFGIAFGSLGLLCSCWQGVSAVGMSMMSGWMEQMQAQLKADREAKIEQFEEDLAAAETEEDATQIQRDHDRWLQQHPDVDFAELTAIATDSRVVAHAVADGIAGLITNSLLIAAGVGMIRVRPWARRLAIGTAYAKVAVIVVSLAVMLLVVIPAQIEAMEKMMKAMESIQQNSPNPPPPMPMPFMGSEATRAMQSVQAVIMALIAAAFPVVLIVLLNARIGREPFAAAERR